MFFISRFQSGSSFPNTTSYIDKSCYRGPVDLRAALPSVPDSQKCWPWLRRQLSFGSGSATSLMAIKLAATSDLCYSYCKLTYASKAEGQLRLAMANIFYY
jgi:hypothetical protein